MKITNLEELFVVAINMAFKQNFKNRPNSLDRRYTKYLLQLLFNTKSESNFGIF